MAVDVDKEVLAKARRRIRKFIETGEHQPRVYPTDDPKVFVYKLKHHIVHLYFKRDVLGRLRLKEVKGMY